MIAIGKPLQLCLFDFRHGILQFANFSCGIAVYIGYHHVQPPVPRRLRRKETLRYRRFTTMQRGLNVIITAKVRFKAKAPLYLDWNSSAKYRFTTVAFEVTNNTKHNTYKCYRLLRWTPSVGADSSLNWAPRVRDEQRVGWAKRSGNRNLAPVSPRIWYSNRRHCLQTTELKCKDHFANFHSWL